MDGLESLRELAERFKVLSYNVTHLTAPCPGGGGGVGGGRVSAGDKVTTRL